MSKKIILSLDAGKFATKAIGRDINGSAKDLKRICFETKKYDLEKGYLDLEGNSYKVVYEGKEYIVGEQGSDKSHITTKTTFLHKLCSYVAITEFLEPSTENNEVYLALACPLSVLSSEDAKEGYRNFIKGDGKINIEVNGKKYAFEIKDIIIKAEGSGILYLEPQLFKNKNVGIIDLGGLNFSFMLYRNGVVKKESRFIVELGSNYLTKITSENLTKYKKGNIVSKEETLQALEKGYLPNFGEMDAGSAEVVVQSKKEYLSKVLDEIEKEGYRIADLDSVIFVGGTTQKIKEYISKPVPHAYITTNSQMSNVEGLYKVAFAKYKDIN